jgi:hypothetical protein
LDQGNTGVLRFAYPRGVFGDHIQDTDSQPLVKEGRAEQSSEARDSLAACHSHELTLDGRLQIPDMDGPPVEDSAAGDGLACQWERSSDRG